MNRKLSRLITALLSIALMLSGMTVLGEEPVEIEVPVIEVEEPVIEEIAEEEPVIVEEEAFEEIPEAETVEEIVEELPEDEAETLAADSRGTLVSKLSSIGCYTIEYEQYGDFDGNGTYEMYAVSSSENLYFANASTAKLLRRDVSYISAKMVSGKTLIVTSWWAGSSSRSYAYKTTSSGPVEITGAPLYNGMSVPTVSGLPSGLVLTYPHEFDATTSGAGGTYKPYFLKFDGSKFTEYGGVKISESQLKQYSGAASILTNLKNSGYSILSIYYRGCNIVNINLRKGSSNYHRILRCNSTGSVTDITSQLDEEKSGTYKACYSSVVSYTTFTGPGGGTVTPPPSGDVVEISGSTSIKLNIGQTKTIVLTNGTPKSFSSSKKTIASVTSAGVISAKKAGKAVITVKLTSGKKYKVTVTVVDPTKATSVSLDKTGTVTLNLGSTLTLKATMQPSTATGALTWTSSNKKIATVSGGVVTPIKEGTVKITVKTNTGKTASVKVKVVDPYKATAVALNYTGTVSLEVGSTLQLRATMTPTYSTSTLSWSSSSSKIASVSSAGLVTAKKKGTATITVKTSSGKTATVKIKVVPVPGSGVEIGPYLKGTTSALVSKMKLKVKDYGKHFPGEFRYIAYDGKSPTSSDFNFHIFYGSPKAKPGLVEIEGMGYCVFGVEVGMTYNKAVATLNANPNVSYLYSQNSSLYAHLTSSAYEFDPSYNFKNGKVWLIEYGEG